MNKPLSLGVAGVLLLSSMHLHADAMGKGLGFDVSPPSQSAAAQGKAKKGAAPLSELKVGLPEVMPANPQCLSGGQPCAEEAQKATDDFKKQHEQGSGNGQQQ